MGGEGVWLMRSSVLGLWLSCVLAVTAVAQESRVPAVPEAMRGQVTLGVLTDLSPRHARIAGAGSIAAAELAIQDFGGRALGQPVRLLTADHANRADLALSTARRWFDQDGVDAIVDVPNGGIAVAVNKLAGERNKLALFSSPMVDRIYGRDCNGHGLAWTWSPQALLRTAMEARLRAGQDTFFLVAADHAAGRMWEASARQAAQALGASITATAWHAYGATDFSQVIADIRAAKARNVLVTSTGRDLVNFLREARASGVPGKKLTALYLFEHDVAEIGLDLMQGVEFVTAFAWQLDERSRAFANRFRERTGSLPTMLQAGVYSATLSWLKAVEAARTADGSAVAAQLHLGRIDDAFARNAYLLGNGRMVHDMYLMRVKTPKESRGPDDLTQVVATVPGERAFRSPQESECAIALPQGQDLFPGAYAFAR